MGNELSLLITEEKLCCDKTVAIQLEAILRKDNRVEFKSKVSFGAENRVSPVSITSRRIESTIEQFRYAADALEKMYKRLKEGDLSKWASPC